MTTGRLARFACALLLAVLVVAPFGACDGDDNAPPRDAGAPTEAPTAPPVAAGAWAPAAPMPTERAETASAVIDGRIYVFGGFGRSGLNVGALEAYDPASDTWTRENPLGVGIDHPAVAALGAKLYVFGGYLGGDREMTDSTYEYDLQTKMWSQRKGMPFERAASAAVTVGETIYVVGGVGPQPEVALAYSPADDSWEERARMPRPREHLAAAAFDGIVYVIGGRWEGEGNNGRVEMYDPAADDWTARASMPTARGGLTAAAVDGRIHVTGGEVFGDEQRTFGEHEIYDPAGDTWAVARPLPTPRHGLASQGIGGRFYVIGGGETPGLSLSATVEVFAAAELAPSP